MLSLKLAHDEKFITVLNCGVLKPNNEKIIPYLYTLTSRIPSCRLVEVPQRHTRVPYTIQQIFQAYKSTLKFLMKTDRTKCLLRHSLYLLGMPPT